MQPSENPNIHYDFRNPESVAEPAPAGSFFVQFV